MKIQRRTFRIILVTGILFFLAIKLISLKKSIQNASSELLPSSYSLTAEDSSLFADRCLAAITVYEIHHSKVRESISVLAYENKYTLIISRIRVKQDFRLDSIVQLALKNSSISTGYFYNFIPNRSLLRFEYKAGSTNPISQIFLTLAGDSIRTIISSKSLLSYYLKCKTLSIQYAKNEPIDILAKGDEEFLEKIGMVPMNVAFLNRKGLIYLMVMVPNNKENGISPNLLGSILRSDSN